MPCIPLLYLSFVKIFFVCSGNRKAKRNKKHRATGATQFVDAKKYFPSHNVCPGNYIPVLVQAYAYHKFLNKVSPNTKLRNPAIKTQNQSQQHTYKNIEKKNKKRDQTKKKAIIMTLTILAIIITINQKKKKKQKMRTLKTWTKMNC